MIIVTGATGFIGRRVVRLLAKKYKHSSILCLIWDKDNELEVSGRKILKNLGVKTKRTDLVTGYNLGTYSKTPNIVIHLAGNTDTYSKDYRSNDVGTRNLLKFCQSMGPKTHFIHISTTAIMSGRKNCNQPFGEDVIPFTSNNYGVSKLKAEYLVKNACKKRRFRLSILRYPTVYGKDSRKNSFFDYIGSLINRSSFLMRLNWPGLTSFVHVDDAAKSVLLVLEKPPDAGFCEIYNVSTESLSLQQISMLVHKKIRRRYKEIRIPKFIWKVLALTRPVIYKTEKYFPTGLYNLLWRFSLLIDNVIYCDSTKIEKRFSQWEPSFVSDKLDDVLIF